MRRNLGYVGSSPAEDHRNVPPGRIGLPPVVEGLRGWRIVLGVRDVEIDLASAQAAGRVQFLEIVDFRHEKTDRVLRRPREIAIDVDVDDSLADAGTGCVPSL